ncbi:MAG: patatin-like phospholipase family protein, partial [Kiritimatiellia bacterium]
MSIGIALGSGSARGWAHIGVLEALHEEGIHPAYVAGTSIGSLVGAAYAAGNLAVLKQAALQIDLRQVIYYFVQASIPRSGLVDGARVAEFLRKNIGAATIEELKLPYRAVAADMLAGEEVVFTSGDLIEAIRSSISMPGIFTPVYTHGRVLVDGGILNPVPVEHVRAMGATKVIAVDINHGLLRKAEKSIPPDLIEKAKQQVAKAADKSPKLSGLA